jgi:hypothetical protein
VPEFHLSPRFVESTFDELQSICRYPRQILVMVKIYIKSVAVGTSAPSGLVTISRSGDTDGAALDWVKSSKKLCAGYFKRAPMRSAGSAIVRSSLMTPAPPSLEPRTVLLPGLLRVPLLRYPRF